MREPGMSVQKCTHLGSEESSPECGGCGNMPHTDNPVSQELACLELFPANLHVVAFHREDFDRAGKQLL
jgi:hypothetical protein